ncbi:diphosphomevalonate decarboxylase [Oceanivirga miroungae]|uniref:diphosphomevalonate decarboxylase n=1 Tax=Oceanivirga miroungae TaxID=1130046 RepID=A0A6I8ME20_9FUSO|nr:diphosphomevalonate decarboxylase [Oceanivirga miroungae]VWL85705.1 diphosphomevalonate decarboxylase [Oceanivirga miroungae]
MSSIAYMNIAIVKYWCKDKFTPYLIPLVPSISLLSTKLYTKTEIKESGKDLFYLNDILQDEKETNKVFTFVDKVVKNRNKKICINTYNNMPTAAGLASSSSGYMALSIELNKFFNLDLEDNMLCKIASIGSGSASRSLYPIALFDKNGEIEKLESNIQFSMIAVIVNANRKKISSRAAMQISKDTSKLLDVWIEKNTEYADIMKRALKENDFNKVGIIMEKSTNLMHEVMKSSTPSIDYFMPLSYEIIEFVKKLRLDGINIYYTMDAGANVKVLFEKKDEVKIKKIFNEKYEGKIIDVI